MSHPEHHAELIKAVTEEFKDIFDNSSQGVYVYLDDDHLACNNKLATMLGYSSSEEMLKTKGPFLDAFVAGESQDDVVAAYRASMDKMVGSTSKVTMKKKDGGTLNVTVMLVPISYQGHMMALHYIS
jgi:PAS domain S-box-containing protein